MAALRRNGHRASLLAPAHSGAVLVGPGAVSGLTLLDSPKLAAFLGGDPPEASLSDAIRSDAVLAVTRSRDLVSRLHTVTARVLTCDPTPPPGLHASRWIAEPLRTLGVSPDLDPPTLVFTPEEKTSTAAIASRLPPRFFALHPGSGSSRKNWPADRFAALARARIVGEPWLLVTGPADDAASRALADLPGAVLARELPPRALGALLGRAGLFVGNDSGVTHLAAAAGAPTLALFGPTDPANWAPVGPSVEVVVAEDGTMEGLEVEAVLEAAGRLEQKRC